MDHALQTWLDKTGKKHPGLRRPLVTLTYAQSLDGCIAARRGQPLAISGQGAQSFTHQLRAMHGAILVGIGTILADDPRLTVRFAEGKDPQPVILDSRLRFPRDAELLRRVDTLPWIATTEEANTANGIALEAAGARLLYFHAGPDGRVPLSGLLKRLFDLGVHSLMVEGGASVITSFLAERLVDRILITIAPLFVGGLHAVDGLLNLMDPLINQEAIVASTTASLFPRLDEWEATRIEEDLLVWGTPAWDKAN